MNVLSLFDGMSCGQIALNRIGIKPTKYYASEVDKHAMQASAVVFSDIIQMSEITMNQLASRFCSDAVNGHAKVIKEARSDEMQRRKAARQRIEEIKENAELEREFSL